MNKKLKKFVVAVMTLGILNGCSRENVPNKETDKAIELYKEEDVDIIVSKAYKYFNENAKSALITTYSNDRNANKEEIVSFEKAGTQGYSVRIDTMGGDGIMTSSYQSPDGFYTNVFGDSRTEKLKKIVMESDPYHYIENSYNIVGNAYYILAADAEGYSYSYKSAIYEDAKKEKKVNEDGSIDIFVYGNIERLNAESKAKYDEESSQTYLNETFGMHIEKEQMAQEWLKKLGEEIKYYPSDYYAKIHIDSTGFITEMSQYRSVINYSDYLLGASESQQIIDECIITKVNENSIEVGDIEIVKHKKLVGEDLFTKSISPEETAQLKDGDVIKQLPDIQTLVNKDLYYILNRETGEIRFVPLEVGYRSWSGVWDITIDSFIDLIKDEELIKILEGMPSFQEAKEKNTLGGRIDYIGNGQWHY